MARTRIMPKGHWDWPIPVPFSQGWRVGDMVFVGGQVSADQRGRSIAPNDIETQTRNVFENIRTILREVGADMKDIVKLNTYYVDDSTGEASREFWEKMTRVRMEYFSEPGPCGTGVRVPLLAIDGLVIEVEAIAVLGD